MAEDSTTDPGSDESVPGPVSPEDLQIEPVTEGILLETPDKDINVGVPSPATEQVENITRMDRRAVEKGFAWTAFFSLFSKVLFPILGLYVSRHLGPGPMGIGGMLMQIIAISEVLRDAGLAQTYMVDHQMDRSKMGSYMAMALVMGLLPAILLFALTPTLANVFATPELLYALPIVGGIVLMNSITTMPAAKMLKEGRIKEQGMISVIAGGIALATCIIMVRLGYGFNAILTQIVVAPVIANTAIFLRSPVTVLHWDLSAFKDTFKRSGTLLAANGLNNLFLQTDIMLIVKYSGQAAAGLYSVALNVAYKPADIISFPLAKVLMVAFGQTSKDHDKLATNFVRAITAVVLFVTPIYITISVMSEPVVLLLFGEKYRGSIPVLSILCLYLGVRTLGNVAGHALVPAGKHAWTLYPWLIALAVTGASLIFIYRPEVPHMDLNGIVWCFTAGALCVYILIVAMTFRFLRPTGEPVRQLWLAVGTTLATGVLIVGIHFLPLSMYVRLGITLAVAPIFHFIVTGMLFDRNWKAYLHKGGPKQLLRSL